ncbi:MAG TPA: hypothetical protein VGG45_00845 [Terracidiphilus sp.]|jgi:hypothetical protein
MQESDAPVAKPELKELVVEASRALALLDAPRLDELAASCEALNRDLDSMDVGEKKELARQAREATADMSVLARVLEATRANRNVMRRLREMCERRLEYDERMIRGAGEAGAEAGDIDGDD